MPSARSTAPFKLAVTGTPFENRLMELWALLSITVPGLYPWPRLFNERVARPVERGGDAEALDRFRARIRPFLLRRTKELVAADLPPKQEQVLDVVLEPKHRKIYDTHLAKERQRILGLVEEDFDRNRIAIFSALTKLRQLALDPALVDPAHDAVGSAKLDLLVDHLEEITAEGHRALVFSQFTSFLSRVRARLAAEDIGATYLDGSTRDRAAVIDEFRSGGAPVFLISLKAGGVGLTLTEADYVFVLDPWWNPAAEAQAVDRAHRIGQTAHVHVYRLVASDTIEEKVMELKGRKAELFAQVIDGEGVMTLGDRRRRHPRPFRGLTLAEDDGPDERFAALGRVLLVPRYHPALALESGEPTFAVHHVPTTALDERPLLRAEPDRELILAALEGLLHEALLVGTVLVGERSARAEGPVSDERTVENVAAPELRTVRLDEQGITVDIEPGICCRGCSLGIGRSRRWHLGRGLFDSTVAATRCVVAAAANKRGCHQQPDKPGSLVHPDHRILSSNMIATILATDPEGQRVVGHSVDQRFQSAPGGLASSQAWNPVSEARLIASSTSPARDAHRITT